jgi:hypothetical protein
MSSRSSRATDFYEIEIGQRIERFGQVAHVWSLYEARPAPGSPTLLKRGANSIQLYNDGARWWIVSTVWDNEREDVRSICGDSAVGPLIRRAAGVRAIVTSPRAACRCRRHGAPDTSWDALP